MLTESTLTQSLAPQGGAVDNAMAGTAAQLRQLAADHSTHKHAEMLAAIAALLDAMVIGSATRH